MLIICLILVATMVLGVSYALLTKNVVGSSNKAIYKVGDLDVKLDDSSSKDISLVNAIPQEDSEGLSGEPYSFLLINNSTTDLKYTIYLEDDKEAKNKCGKDCELVPYKFIRYNLANDSESLKTSNLSTISNALYTGTIKSKATDKFNLRVWLSIDADNTAMNKYYFGKIKVVVGQGDTYCKDNGFNTLSDCMLVMNNHESSIDIAKTNIKSKGTPDFSKTATTDEGLFMAEDDEGESYYYRGAVKNNYVSFAGFIWRIIRRNGDGSVRMIYSGKKTSDTGEATAIGKSSFNYLDHDPTYTGYKYSESFSLHENNKETVYFNYDFNKNYNFGTSYIFDKSTKKFSLTGNIKSLNLANNYDDVVGNYQYSCLEKECRAMYKVVKYNQSYITVIPITYSSNNYENTLKNDIDSSLKKAIDIWFKSNLIKYNNYLADNIFCNERTVVSGDGYSTDNDSIYLSGDSLVKMYTPKLKCNNSYDKFSVSNQLAKLDYPIATVTADEVVMSGGKSSYKATHYQNDKYYLYNGIDYWTMTPDYYANSYTRANVFAVISSGAILPYYYVGGENFVRPVINLKPDITISSGDGTADAPYKID